MRASTATLPGLANLSFSLAKLVPGANGSPRKLWSSTASLFCALLLPTPRRASIRAVANPAAHAAPNRGPSTLAFSRMKVKISSLYRTFVGMRRELR
jgi:hypothetical protein